jgi:hypothetical protein
MQTREENLNDLIGSLKISSAYRQRQEQLWRQQTAHNYQLMVKEEWPEKIAQWH